MTISNPLVTIVGVLVLVAWRYTGLTAWQAFWCLLAGFLCSQQPVPPR